MLTPIASSLEGKQQTGQRDIVHVSRHYKSIGIGALASALSVLKQADRKSGPIATEGKPNPDRQPMGKSLAA